jgi:hypothetical protein
VYLSFFVAAENLFGFASGDVAGGMTSSSELRFARDFHAFSNSLDLNLVFVVSIRGISEAGIYFLACSAIGEKSLNNLFLGLSSIR